MAKPIDEIRLAWNSIQRGQEDSGWKTVAVLRAHPGRFRAGLHFPEGCEALLAGFGAGAIPAGDTLPEGIGFSVARVDMRADGLTWIALTRSLDGNPEMFSAMVSDVVEAFLLAGSGEDERDLGLLLGRIRAWQEFMRKGAAPLSAEGEIGLVGELSALGEMIDAGVPLAAAIDSWVGPTAGGTRDFVFGHGAVEVKTTLASAGFVAKIGSLEQLDDAICNPIYLCAIRMELSDLGQTLPELIGTIRARVQCLPQVEVVLEGRLRAAGYLPAHSAHYHRRFALKELAVFEVDGNFPRMTRGTVMRGVIRASYEISLDGLAARDVGLLAALKNLKVM